MPSQLGKPSKLRLSPTAVHEIRVSPGTHKALGKRFGVSPTTIHHVRNGGNGYGRLTFEERVITQRRRDGLDQTWLPREYRLVVNSLFHDLEPVIDSQDRQETMDAAHECVCGRLPHDRTPACGCWPQEQDQPQGGRNGNNHHQHHHQHRVQRFAAQAVQAEQGSLERREAHAGSRIREPA